MDQDFKPPRCPNPDCALHSPKPGEAYLGFRPWGYFDTQRSGRVRRYRCAACGRCFSAQTFRPDYWLKRPSFEEDLARRLASRESMRAIGRAWGLSGKAVQLRIARRRRLALAAAGFGRS
jgi:hypothetical protein